MNKPGFEHNACSLYIHIPWCIRKCPYCDFNSHALKGLPDEAGYLQCLVEDFKREWELSGKQVLTSVFIGGGTPSVMSGDFYNRLFEEIGRITELSDTELSNLEITLEANPGTADAGNFEGYRKAGINRLSLGVQSFDNPSLVNLGRIHNSRQVFTAFDMARKAGFDNINLDLMFALPGQTSAMAGEDLHAALELQPEHISWYQLTMEPNTPFYATPPADMPDDDQAWEIQQQGQQLLQKYDYAQYEISAYSKTGRQCRHNLNYWRFGDYIGIGAGAHGKITSDQGRLIRRTKHRSPETYLAGQFVSQQKEIPRQDLLFEYLLNRFRLQESFSLFEATACSGVDEEKLMAMFQPSITDGLLLLEGQTIRVTSTGHQYLNELLGRFLD